MALLTRFEAFVAEHDLIARDRPIVVGVSGGVDSVTLLHLLTASGFQSVAVHVNYGLRGAASEADEALVRDLCAAWEVPLRVERVRLAEGNVQAEARAARYAAFGRTAEEAGAQTVATAHHRGDQAETLLLNLFRGAGPAGLAGMPLRRPLAPGSSVEVVRPLLFAPRAEIAAYAATHALRWREDASNHEGDYRRTTLRETIIPALEAAFGDGVRDRLADTADRFRAYLDSGAALASDAALDALARRSDGGWALPVAVLRAEPVVVRHGLVLEALRRWAPEAPRSAAAVQEIGALVEAQPGRSVVWPGVTVWRDRDRLVFVPQPAAVPERQAVTLGTTVTAAGILAVEEGRRPERFEASPCAEYADAGRLRFPLTLRPWQPGDTLQPLGLDGSKKVSDLLTDRKVPPQHRAHQLVLVSGGEIVWVVGHRLADPFRVRPETRRVVRLTWTPTNALDGEGDAA